MTADIDNQFEPAAPVVERPATRADVLGALRWSAPREVTTKNGPRIVTKASANQPLFDLWAREAAALKSDGYSLGEWPQGSGKWSITKWEKLPQKIVVQRTEAAALSRATDATINAPVPDGLEYLPFQRAGIAYAFEREAVLIGDEMGLGKTVQAAGVLNACPELRRVLVICPASLKLNWRNELNRWLVRKRPIFIADSKAFVAMADGITVINYDVLHKHEAEIRGTEWDVLICDEAHYCKNPKSRRARMVFGQECSAKERANGAAPIPGITAKKRLLLTGTPIANKPVELYPLIHYLDPATWSNFFRYAIRYCAAYEGSHGWDFSGASNLGELQEKLRSTILVRRLKKDVLTELPAKRRQVIEFGATEEMGDICARERDAYEQVDDLEARVELAAASEDKDGYDAAVKALAAGQRAVFEGLSTLRLETARAKIPLVVEHLREAIEASGKVVVMAHHKEVVRAIAAEFGAAAVMLVGDTAMADRQAAVERFQTDPTCTLFIGSILAAGVGITLTAASHVVFAELSWVPGDISQAEDRCHRIGQRESVLVQHLVLEGSLDATMARRIIAKQAVIDRALDVVAASPEQPAGPPRTSADPREAIAAEAANLTPAQIDAAGEAVRYLAARCNGARDWDGAGFSKLDTRIGKELAALPMLTPKQAALALRIAGKYAKTQLPESIVCRMKGAS